MPAGRGSCELQHVGRELKERRNCRGREEGSGGLNSPLVQDYASTISATAQKKSCPRKGKKREKGLPQSSGGLLALRFPLSPHGEALRTIRPEVAKGEREALGRRKKEKIGEPELVHQSEVR